MAIAYLGIVFTYCTIICLHFLRLLEKTLASIHFFPQYINKSIQLPSEDDISYFWQQCWDGWHYKSQIKTTLMEGGQVLACYTKHQSKPGLHHNLYQNLKPMQVFQPKQGHKAKAEMLETVQSLFW